MITSRIEGLDFAESYTRKFNTYVTNLRAYNLLLNRRLKSKEDNNTQLERDICWAKHIAEESLEAMIAIMEELTSRKPQPS